MGIHTYGSNAVDWENRVDMPRLREERLAKLQAELNDPDLYRRDPAKFEKTSTALSAKSAELEAAEERWLELEMLREAAEG